MTKSENMSVDNPEVQEILKSKLKFLNDFKHVAQDLPQCEYINLKGVQCPSRCYVRTDGSRPRCHNHLNSVDVIQCSIIYKDENGNDVQCTNLTRSKKGTCHYHTVKVYNKINGKKYYDRNREKICEEKRLSKLIIRLDKMVTQVDGILNPSE